MPIGASGLEAARDAMGRMIAGIGHMVAEAVEDPELQAFYEGLYKSEAKHGHLFVQLLLQEVEEDLVYPRLHELAEVEADIIR